MPLCPQITNTAVTVTSTGMTTTSVTPVVTATSTDIATVQASADGKNVITYSSASPSGSGTRVGDIWWQYSGATVIGQWAWSGSAWTNAPITNAVIANIDAAKITAGYIDVANRIQAGSIDAAKITANTITASQIASSTITATQIAASTITAAKLATGTLSATNVEAGTLSASVALTAQSGTIGGWNITTGSIYTGTLGSPNQYLSAAGGALFTGTTTCSALGVNSNLTVGGTATITSTLNANASVTFGTSNTFQYLSSSGVLRSAFTYGNAVTSARAMQINGSGDFGTTASTRRKKHEIQPYTIDLNALLQLEVKSFKYLPEIDPTQTIQHGFIAEEAQTLGLDELIQFDSDGIPDYFAYEKLSTFLLSLVQDLSKRVAELEKK